MKSWRVCVCTYTCIRVYALYKVKIILFPSTLPVGLSTIMLIDNTYNNCPSTPFSVYAHR